MKVSGFTIARNVVKFDYPIVEAISSVLPLCDEFIVAVGKSEDNTRWLIESIDSSKIRIIDTEWDDSMRKGGRVLAQETNKALKEISPDSDWAFYIQGDEVLHEKYLDTVRNGMKKWKGDKNVEGLLFNYLHFYGSYDYTGDSRKWYRREIRVIRNNKSISSYGDAQGFRKNNQKLKVKEADACIYHYGWVKPPALQQAKQENFHKMWHEDAWVAKNIPRVEAFDYSGIDSLARFTGTHPGIMEDRIKRKNWDFTFDPTKRKMSLKSRLLMYIEKKTGWRIGEYRNYIIVRSK